MGADIEIKGSEVIARSSTLRGMVIDCNDFIDQFMLLAVVGALAEGETVLTNAESCRYKECDRITDYLAELRKAGARVDEKQDEIIVHGRPEGVEGGVEIDAHFDHRVIMALTIVGLRSARPIRIKDAHHVAKSYPIYFDHLKSLGAQVEWVN
jgi:3-phosphoshikimate 1-carboxyvinyltransferase